METWWIFELEATIIVMMPDTSLRACVCRQVRTTPPIPLMERRLKSGGIVVFRRYPLVSWQVSAFAAYCSTATNIRLLCQSNQTFGNLIHDHSWEFYGAERIAKVLFGISGGPFRILVNQPTKHWRTRQSPARWPGVEAKRTRYHLVLTSPNNCIGACHGALDDL